jgi:hypothetical protein
MNKKHLGLACFSLIGIAVLVCGVAVLWDYSKRPGLPAHAQKNWPQQTGFERHSTFPTLVMFVHPH